MKTIVFVVVAAVLVNTATAEEPKEVNIALETVLRFGNKDPSSGIGVIDKVQTALENIKKGIEVRNGRRSNANDMTFTDFTAEAAKILKEYNDNDLEDVFDVIGDEIKRYINREVGFQKWFGSDNLRRHLSDQLAGFKEMQADTMRQYLDKAIIAVENKKYKGENNDLLDIGNFLYIGASHKLKSAIRNLDKLRRASDVRLDNVIREILIFVFFDHISKLNENTKRELMEVIADYFKINKQGKQNTRSSTMDSIEAYAYTSKRNNQFSENKIDVKDDKRNKGELRSIHRTKTVHKNKRYDYQRRIQKDRHAVTGFTKLYKLKDSTRVSKEKNALLGSKANNKTPFESITDKKLSAVTRQTNNTKTKYTQTINQSDRSRFSIKDRKITTKSMLLTGGQRKLNIDLRGQASSSEETYEHLDNTKEELQSPQDIIDKRYHSKPYLSVERFLAKKGKNISKVNKEEDEQMTSTVNDANMSGEGLSIEEFTNDRRIEHEAIRKYNKPEKPNITVTEAQKIKAMTNKNTGMQENVKGQYDFVRNLTAVTDDMLHKPTFRASHDFKPKSKAKTKHHYPNSASLEKNNQEFFLRDSSERIINETTKKLNSTMKTHDTKEKINVLNQKMSTKASTVKTSTVSKINHNTTTKAAPKTTITKTSTVKSTITTVHSHIVNTVKSTIKNVSQIDNKISNITRSEINKNVNVKASSIKPTTVNTTINKIVTKGIQDHYTFNPLLLFPE